MSIKLHLGKMTGHEISEWLGVKYSRYHSTRLKQLEKLEGYCEFEIVRGGIIVKEIYTETYCKDLNVRKTIDKELKTKAKKTHYALSSASGVMRVHCFENEDANENTIYYKASKELEAMFDKTNINVEEEGIRYQGPCGYREKTWAIKIGELNDYRELTEEEDKLFGELAEKFYHLPAKKAKMVALLDKELKKKEITTEKYIELKEEIMGGNYYSNIIMPFIEQTGKILVQVQRYWCNNEYLCIECPWED